MCWGGIALCVDLDLYLCVLMFQLLFETVKAGGMGSQDILFLEVGNIMWHTVCSKWLDTTSRKGSSRTLCRSDWKTDQFHGVHLVESEFFIVTLKPQQQIEALSHTKVLIDVGTKYEKISRNSLGTQMHRFVGLCLVSASSGSTL